MGQDQSEPNTINVMIVDDHPLFRAGLQRAFDFEDDISIIGYCDEGESVLEKVRDLKPDVILLDVNLPGINGLQVTRQLRGHNIAAGIIILTAHHDSEQILHALRSGASAYCAKDITPDELMQTIRQVASGYFVVAGDQKDADEMETWLNERIEDSTGPHVVDSEGHFIPLSPREMEILEYVTHGMINKEIATKLGISQQTVKNHMTSILKKLNVKDRTQAAVIALRRGWVRIDNKSQEA